MKKLYFEGMMQMEERSLRITGADKTFFTKITNALTKMLIPTKIGINGMLISIKRNNLLKAFESYNAENENYNKDELEKKYDTAYEAYLDSLDKYVMDSIYKKVRNGTASEFEKNAMSKYYEVTSLKEKEYMEYKYRKQKYLLELDNESVKNTAKEKVIEKYNRFYVSKQDSLYKGILKNYSIKLADSTNIYDSSKDWIYVKIFNTLEDYMKNILPLKISDPKLESVSKDYEKYEKFSVGKLDTRDNIEKNMILLGISRNLFTHSLPLGRTPKEVSAIRPLKDGVIADFTATKLLLKKIMDKVCKKYNAVRPRVIVGVPSGITEVEERAVEETIIRAGAKEVYLIEEPMAAAIGAGIEIEQPSGNIIVDIGGGTTEVAVISLGGIVLSNSIRIAGDELNEDIINYVKRELNLAIGETTAENIKKELGCALPLMSQMSMKIKGRDLATGLPATEIITSGQVEEAIKDSIAQIVEVVKLTLEKTPPELASDIMEKGIMLSGGGALVQNLDKLISMETGMPTYVAEDPLECVVRGTGKTLQDIDKLRTVLKNARKR